MSDTGPLTIDLDFRANNDEALAALAQTTGAIEQIEQSFAGALDSAQGIAAALSTAGDNFQPSLFADAAASADGIASGLTTAATAADDAALATGTISTALDDAAAAVGALAEGAADTGTQLSLFGDTQDKVSESVKQTTESQKQQTEETAKSVDLAGRLSSEFEKIQSKVAGLVGPMSSFTDEAFKAVQALEGASGIAAGGLAAGAAGLLAAGSAYKSSSDTITLATGATGLALDGLRDDFDQALTGSGRAAGDLAQILAGLNRDTGITGDALSELTDHTAKFLKVTQGGVGDVRGLTQSMLALGVGAEGLEGFEDQLAKVTTTFGISLSSLLQQIKVGGPALKTFGFDPGQIAGLIGELDQAGLSITRLTPGFTKLAKAAASDGKTASQALADLIARIKGANDDTAALQVSSEVFSGRVAAGFSNAVRQNVVDLDKLNAVLAEAPGTVDELGEAVKGLSGQFGGIKNDILEAFGRQGLPLLEDLRSSIEDIRPTLRTLFDVIATLGPAFKGFGEAALLPLEAFKLLGPPLELLDSVLSHIPGPVLEAVGALAAFKLLPFGAISNGLLSITQRLIDLPFAAASAASAEGALTTVIGAINPLALVAAAGIGVLAVQMHKHQQDEKELKERVEALNKALGDLSITAEDAAPKIEELLAAGSKGHLIDDRDLATLKAAGVSVDDFTGILQRAASDPNQDVTKELRRALVEGAGGIKNLIGSFDNLHNPGRAKEIASTAEGEKKLTDEFINQNKILGDLDPHLRDVEAASKGVLKAEQDRAKGQLDTLQGNHDIAAADREATAAKLGLKDESENEIAVRDALTSKVNEEKLGKLGLATADQATNQARVASLASLNEEGAAHDQVADSLGAHAKLLNLLAEASRGGVASDQDRIKIMEETGVEAKDLAKAEQELLELQAQHTPVTQEFNNALRNTFEQIGHGTPEWQALSGAAQAFNVDVTQLGPAFDQLNSKLQGFAEPIKAGDDVMGQLLIDMQQGLPIQTTFKDLLEVSGGNAEVAFAALNDYKQGVEATTKALDGLNPSLGTTLSKLEDAAAAESDPVGLNAEGAGLAIAETAKARKKGFQDEIADLQAAKQARGDADQASIDAQKAALQDQKQLAQDAAKTRGETFDSTAIDLQIKALKAHTDTDDLDAQIKDLEGRQKGVDDQLARAGAALAVFNDEERAIRARSSLQDSDLKHQQDVLAASRLVAEQQAAAQGLVFDPTAINNRINSLQVQRDKLTAGTGQAVADAQAASQRVQGAVEDAQGGLLGFGAVLDTFDAKLRTEALQAQTVSELKGQGFDSIVKILFDPEAGLNAADQSAFLNAIATASPEERAAIDAHAKESLMLIGEKDSAVKAAGDIFADPNATAVDNAKKRGDELATGLADGFVQTLDESKINEIIDLVIKTGVDPAAARRAVTDKFAAAKAAAAPAAEGLAGVGISVDQVQGIEDALGLAGTTSGALFVQATQEAIRTTTIDPDAAAAMLQPVQDQLPIEGAAGGASVASTADEAIRNSPIPPDAATVLVEGLRAGLSAEGTNGGAGYAISVHGGIGLYPVPTEAGTILVASVSQALSVAGTDAGANYALGVAAGIAAKQGDATQAAYLAAQSVDAAGNAALANASPSKKGIKTGGFWIDGIVAGITDNIGKVQAAAFAVGDAVSAPLPVPVGAGVGSTGGAGASEAARFGGGTGGTATSVHIENVNVTGTTNATGDDVATALSRKIGWIGITGRAEL